MSRALRSLARRLGIETSFVDAAGRRRSVSPDTLRAILAAIGVDAPSDRAALAALREIAPAAPEPPAGEATSCPRPEELGVARCWGVACLLPSLRRDPDPGIGDFAALAALARRAAAAGADFLAVSPLHALFPANPDRCSPYAPSHRRWLNALAVAPDLVEEVRASPAARRLLAAAAGSGPRLVDYRAAAASRLAVLGAGWRHFRRHHLRCGEVTSRGAAFLRFRRAGGGALENHCRFDAIGEWLRRAGRAGEGWPTWPAELRDPKSSEVARLARRLSERVAFYAWVQWLASEQLAAAHDAARSAGMRVGLCRDLAVGLSPDGSAAWSHRDAIVRGVTVGAPPDAFNPHGQDWGLAPFSPRFLERHNLEPLASDLRANLEHAGALRVDHAMALRRLYWIPAGASPAEGAYVRYPGERLGRLLAGEARRRGVLIVGEDLGTVPRGFRPFLRRLGMLGMRVLWFERQAGGSFRAPRLWDRLATAAATTHDLPTVRGHRHGRDIEWRERLGILDRREAERERRRRAHEVRRLQAALRREALLGRQAADDIRWAAAVHAFVARARCSLATVQAEDLAGEIEQPNLPGTIDGHPNWRRRLPPVERLLQGAAAQAILEAVRAERPR